MYVHIMGTQKEHRVREIGKIVLPSSKSYTSIQGRSIHGDTVN